MISPELYKNSGTYDFFMKLFGFESSIDRFLHGIELGPVAPARILDAGCGTGLLGLHFLERYPDARLLATDLEPNFLQAALANAERREIDRDRISVGVADISDPSQYSTLEGEPLKLAEGSFDLICVGAVVGYSGDTESTIRRLLHLLSPGGLFLNIEMNESPAGRIVSHLYHYRNIQLDRMQDVIREQGCEVKSTKLKLRCLPAKLTRTALIAHMPKSVSEN